MSAKPSVKLDSPYSRTPRTVRVPSGKQPKATSGSTTKFYVSFNAEHLYLIQTQDGPTVPALPSEPTTTRRVAKRPWSLISLLTTLPFLLAISLFSTIACPPTSKSHSSLSHLVLSPFGLHDGSSPHSQLHQTLCYPANVYHDQVLEPYVYPVVDDVKARLAAHPLYHSTFVPVQAQVAKAGAIAQPFIRRIQLGLRRIYLTFIDPHLPYLRAKTHSLVAPYTSRASALYATYLAHHVDASTKYAQAAGKRTSDTYKWAAAHPYTGQTKRYADKGYQKFLLRSQQAYAYSRPHAQRFGREADRIARQVLGPKAVDAVEWVILQLKKGSAAAHAHASALYRAHLEPHVGPYVTKASVAISPYTSALHAKLYVPYIRPALITLLPPAVVAEKSFWEHISSILPSPRTGEHRADLPYAEKVQSAAQAFDRKEMNRIFASAKKQIETQGKHGYESVRQQLVEFNSNLLSDDGSFSGLKTSARSDLDRDIDYVTKGLDKLYTTSTVLTREQVAQSSKQADARIARKVQELKDRAEKIRIKWNTQSSKVVRDALSEVNAALGEEWSTLAEKMAWLDDVTPKDWTTYNSLQDSLDSWSKKYIALHNGETKDKELLAPGANLNRAIAGLNTEFDEIFESFRDLLKTLRQTALNRIEAREVLAAESAASASKAAKKTAAKVAEEGKVSILPVVEAADAVIGKGKEQVVEALSQADAAVHQATRSVVKAAGGTPTPETPEEHLESVKAAAASHAQAAYTAAGVKAQAASSDVESIASAASQAASAGAETVSSVVQSVLASAPESAASTASEFLEFLSTAATQVSESYSSATRAASRAAGATPTPETIPEYVEEYVSRAAAAVGHDEL